MRNWLLPCLFLAACADVPVQPARPAPDPASMQRFYTSDPDEIRRRFGDYALNGGASFITAPGGTVTLTEYRWEILGALMRVDSMACNKTPMPSCPEHWRSSVRVQYDPQTKQLNFVEKGIVQAHGIVRGDGSVVIAWPGGGGGKEFRFDYDKDEGIYVTHLGNERHIPTEAKKFAEIRKQWKEADAQTNARIQPLVAALEAERRAQYAEIPRDTGEAQRSPNISGAINAATQAYNNSMQGSRQQQAQSMERIARAAETQRSASAPAPRRDPPRTNAEALRASVASQPAAPVAIKPSAPVPSRPSAPVVVASAQPQGNATRAAEQPRSKLIATPEAILVCSKPSGPNGVFECLTPASRIGGNLNQPSWRTPQKVVDGADSCSNPRRLPSTTHLVWGCGYGATNNYNTMDRSAGVDVKGRETYYCHPKQLGCRKTEP